MFVLQAFGEDFLEDKLKPFFKSDPIPETVSLFCILYLFIYFFGFPSHFPDDLFFVILHYSNLNFDF